MGGETDHFHDPFQKPVHAPDHPYWHKDQFIRMVDYEVKGRVIGQYDEAFQIRNFAYEFYSKLLPSWKYNHGGIMTPKQVFNEYQAWRTERLKLRQTTTLQRRTLDKVSLYDVWVLTTWKANLDLHMGTKPEALTPQDIAWSAMLDQLAATVEEAYLTFEAPPTSEPPR